MIRVEITTYDRALFDEFAAAAAEPLARLPENTMLGPPRREAEVGDLHGVGVPEVLTFVVNLGAGFAVNMFSAWLWEKIKGRVSRVRLDGRDVRLSLPDITGAFQDRASQRMGDSAGSERQPARKARAAGRRSRH